ncbi:hypothetical protein CEXT_673651 [Caerostris extrusa]|uniref:Uncharacterized protein n=1 Tax=Caerostris extrusa TaxID=172846 RepID=A0AAV4QBL6_CAEEX|nr:hypothetical protein CEXT_673651 [Caerostris extrusa]
MKEDFMGCGFSGLEETQCQTRDKRAWRGRLDALCARRHEEFKGDGVIGLQEESAVAARIIKYITEGDNWTLSLCSIQPPVRSGVAHKRPQKGPGLFSRLGSRVA